MRYGILTIIPLVTLLGACGQSDGQHGNSSPQDLASADTAITSSDGSESASRMPPSFARCRSCHAVEPGVNGIGPSLAGIVGSKAGNVPGYRFSPALEKSGIVWDRQTLDTWLQGPSRMVPGTKMTVSTPDPELRKSIIDYLESLN